MDEEEIYIDYYGCEVKLKRISYPKIIEFLKRDTPPQRTIMWYSFE